MTRPMTSLVAALVVLALATGCGTDPDREIRVAPIGFDGAFQITSVDGPDPGPALSQLPQLLIGTEFGDLEVLPGCNTYYGSFTLDESGRASFTVTGGTDADCGLLDAQEGLILGALERVERWRETADGFTFEGPETILTVVRLDG